MMSVAGRSFEVPIPTPEFDLWESETEKPRLIRSCSSQGGLPSIAPLSGDPFRTITADDLSRLLTDPMSHDFERIIIIDARFWYEFRGGRITGARNVTTRSELAGIYNQYRGQNVCIVFHCEFSRNRGPTLMRLFRDYDRRENGKNYPDLCYPNILLLEGGYSNFYSKCRSLCNGDYVRMRDPRFVENGELRRCHSDYSREILQDRQALPKRRSSSHTLVSMDALDGPSLVFNASQPL